MDHRAKLFVLAALALAAALPLMIVGLIGDAITPSDLLTFGSALMITGVLVGVATINRHATHQVNRPADEAYLQGVQVGYDKGYTEAVSHLRPNVVQLIRPDVPDGNHHRENLGT
jgi:hypothetical protein